MRNMLSALAVPMVIATPALEQTAGLEQSRPAAFGSVATAASDAVAAASAGAFSELERPRNLFATPAQGHQRDSLRNGVLGAGIRAMLGLAFGVSREDACTACAGFNQPLTYGALFAGVGARIGGGHRRDVRENLEGRFEAAARSRAAAALQGRPIRVGAVRF